MNMWLAHHLNRGEIFFKKKSFKNMELNILISFLCTREYDIQVSRVFGDLGIMTSYLTGGGEHW